MSYDSTGIPGENPMNPMGKIEMIAYNPEDEFTRKDSRFAILNMVMGHLNAPEAFREDSEWDMLFRRVRQVEAFLDELNEVDGNDKGKGKV